MRFRLAERRSFVSVGHRLTNPTSRAFLCFSLIRLLHLIEESFGILLMHSRSGWGQLPTAPRRVESCACSKEISDREKTLLLPLPEAAAEN